MRGGAVTLIRLARVLRPAWQAGCRQFDELGDIVANDLVLVMDGCDFQDVHPIDVKI